ncbi:MAG: hypothetical protein KGM99_06280 [Burkholderiales bacterium]|nr:hypothetical protein [Burkholderiales bacterium]
MKTRKSNAIRHVVDDVIDTLAYLWMRYTQAIVALNWGTFFIGSLVCMIGGAMLQFAGLVVWLVLISLLVKCFSRENKQSDFVEMNAGSVKEDEQT